MGYYLFDIRFREHVPTRHWDTRKYEIANFIAGAIWNSREDHCIESLYWNAKAFAAGSRLAKNYTESLRVYEEAGKGWFGVNDGEAYGVQYCVSSNIIRGLTEKYPDIDFEFHQGELGDGDDTFSMTIHVGDKWGGGSFSTVYDPWFNGDTQMVQDLYDEWAEDGMQGDPPPTTAEEFYEQEIFQTPEATEENPWPVADFVSDPGMGSDGILWWECELFR
mgnify:CR=1 FL=1